MATDVTKYKEVLVFQQLLTFFKSCCSNNKPVFVYVSHFYLYVMFTAKAKPVSVIG